MYKIDFDKMRLNFVYIILKWKVDLSEGNLTRNRKYTKG